MAGVLGEDVLKRIKALRKKLSQIEKLKARGGQYTEEEATKIKGESKILAEIQALEKGEEVAAFDEVGGQEEAPPEAKPDPEDGAEAEVSASKEPDLAPAEAEKRIRGLKKKLGQIQKLKERGGGFSKEESEKVGSEPSLLAECTELEIKLLEPESRKTARNLQKKLDQILKLRAKGGQLTPQEREKVGKETSLKKEFADLLAARVPVKEPASQAEQSPAPDAKAAPKATQAVAQKQASVSEVKPQPQPLQPAQHKPAPRISPQSEQAPMSTYMGPPPSMTATHGVAAVEDEAHVEDDAHVAAALAQAFAQEEFLEEEGFHESRASTRKRASQAKAQARAAERAQQEQEAALLRQEQDRRLEERQLAAQRAQEEERLAAAPREREASLAAAGEAAAEEEDEELGPSAEEAQVEELAEPQPTAPAVEVHPEAARQATPQAPQHAVEPVPDEVAPQAAAPLEPAVAPEAAPDAALDAAPVPERPVPEKRLRALRKKVTQIEKLKQRGGEYTPEESEKLASEDCLLAEITALEKGDPWPPVVEAAPEPAPVVPQEEILSVEVTEAPPPAAPPLEVSSMDPVDAQKRLKALKKKLGQIEKLKERSGPFSPEETTKIASQQHVLADIKKLEEYLA